MGQIHGISAEYRIVANTSSELTWILSLLQELGLPPRQNLQKNLL